MSKNNEHLNEFIMLCNIMRDAATVMEKAYRRAVTDGAHAFEDPECDNIVSRALTAAQNIGAMADAASVPDAVLTRGEMSKNWLINCARECYTEEQVQEFIQYVRERKDEYTINAFDWLWVQALTLESINEL
jgi:hypothetical protein